MPTIEHGVASVIPANNVYRCVCGADYTEAVELADHITKKTKRFIGELGVTKFSIPFTLKPGQTIPPITLTPPPMVEPVNLGSDGCDEPLVAPAKRDALLNLHRELSARALALMTRKNQDYAKESDPYANFRMFGALGILVRLSDKLARLRSYEEKGTFAVNDEGLIDTTLDLINYAILYYGYKQQETK